MPQGPFDPKQLGFYITLSQVGLEMAAPVVVGVLVDYNLDSAPWGTIVGAVLGLVGGLGHMIVLLNRRNGTGPGRPPTQES
jgi:F0F1-type ATP synthase assembly protein I